jgi:hypothetical protein
VGLWRKVVARETRGAACFSANLSVDLPVSEAAPDPQKIHDSIVIAISGEGGPFMGI